VIAFPGTLQPDVDALVAAAQKGVAPPLPESFARVTAWCEADDDESGVLQGADGGEGSYVVWRGHTLPRCSDDEWADNIDPEDVTDDDRIGHIMITLRGVFEGDFADDYPMAASIPIRSTLGKEACLGYVLSGGGYMGGLAVTWSGAYRSERAFLAALRREGALISLRDAKRLSRGELLEFWER
jgi:hypothetical protein